MTKPIEQFPKRITFHSKDDSFSWSSSESFESDKPYEVEYVRVDIYETAQEDAAFQRELSRGLAATQQNIIEHICHPGEGVPLEVALRTMCKEYEDNIAALTEDCESLRQRLEESENSVEDLRLINSELTDSLIAANMDRTNLSLRLEAAEKKLAEIFALANYELSDYHHQAMGCGLEDRCITDRYEAMYYGYHEAIDKVYDQILTPILELDAALTPTDQEKKS